MTFPNDRPRTATEMRDTTGSQHGSLRRQRPMGGWIAGLLALAVVAVAVFFLLPNHNNTTASNTSTGLATSTNSGSKALDPARTPASTTGSGTTSPTPAAPTTAPTTTR